MSRTLETYTSPRPPTHHRPPQTGFRRLIAILLVLTLGVLVWRSGLVGSLLGGDGERASPEPGTQPAAPATGSQPTAPAPGASPTTEPTAEPTPGPINTAFPGLTTFRGNATRSYYGEGPVPSDPQVLWRFPASGGLCSTSNNLGQSRVWCGTGWTGQPNIIEHGNGRIEVRIGAYDGKYHFLNGRSGRRMRPPLATGDLAKGSATSDADGYPLYYAGSRDNLFRIVALDREEPTVLWQLDANANPNKQWNDDWDAAALQIGDYLLQGGENSWFYVIRLNRGYDQDGLVGVDPEIVMMVPGYDDQLFRDLGDRSVSIENSVAFHDGVAYFANSGGLVQGWDISDILAGGTRYERVFRFWAGDEVDASIVIDEQGYLYVARHRSFNIPNRPQARAQQIGSLMKLDPRKPNDPLVWDTQIGGFEPDGGMLGTPALYEGRLYVTDTAGALLAVNAKNGRILWRIPLVGPTWGSPVTLDDRVIVGDCQGGLHAFDISNRRQEPPKVWTVQLEGCLESTPAVWKGRIWVGARGGAIYGIGDA